MIRRIFSRETYNGYHLVSFKGEGEDGPVGFFKKLPTKDEYGFMADTEDMPQCPHPGHGMGRPWDNFLYVPSDCQKCCWLYRTPQEMDYDCLLLNKANVSPNCLVKGER